MEEGPAENSCFSVHLVKKKKRTTVLTKMCYINSLFYITYGKKSSTWVFYKYRVYSAIIQTFRMNM